jgi:CubicO group peptidase (beta-lactamase class C family)
VPFANFDAHASQALDDWKVPAMAISVVKDGRVVFARGYGVRQLGGNARVDADTVFPIASITKAFNATALAMLVDEGRVQWTDPVIKHIPEFRLLDPWMTREVTLVDCLAHRNWSDREFIDGTNGAEDRVRAAAIARLDRERRANVKPKPPLSQYAGTYLSDLFGKLIVVYGD